MKLARSEFEKMFDEYREHLRREIHCFCDCAAILHQINDHTHDHLAEINLAPGFFHTTEDALFNTVIVWADKLLDEHGERGLFNFLTFVEYNRDWLVTEELRRRKGYADDHWMLKNRVPITAASIEADRSKIRSLAALPSIRLRRDKYQGHFDKKYFFDRTRLHNEAAITWKELDEASDVIGSMLNDYSVDFDGVFYSWDSPSDLSRLLNAARRAKDHAD